MLFLLLFGVQSLGFCANPSQVCTAHSECTNEESVEEVEKKSDLFIFVSLEMPKDSLLQWSEQANKAGGVLVLRGLKNNSLPQTLALTNNLWGAKARNVIIDPNAFERFAIKSVPAVLITNQALQPCTKEACPIPAHDVIYGDVGLGYSLNKIKEQGEMNNLTQNYLKRLNR